MARKESQRGVILVFLAIVLILLLLFIALLVTLAILAVNRAHIQNIANLAALAGVEEAVREGASSGYQERADAIRDRVEFIIQSNQLIAAPSSLLEGELGFSGSSGPGGTIRFGVWHPELPPQAPYPCGSQREDYPCFVEHPPPGSGEFPATNAIRLDITTQGPLSGPFYGLLESLGVNLSAQATGIVVPRAVEFVLDASMSSTEDSHPSRVFSEEENSPAPYYSLTPSALSLFAYNDWISIHRLPSLKCNGMPPNPEIDPPLNLLDPLGWNPCVTYCLGSPRNNYIYQARPGGQDTWEGKIWCNMQWDAEQSSPSKRKVTALNGAEVDWDSCYQYENTPYGRMLIDKCFDPEPLTSFFLGFNAGLRLLDSQKTAADQARLSIFRGTPNVNPYPTGSDLFTKEFESFIQLTNVLNRGTLNRPEGNTAAVYPNFLHMGWFPIYNRGIADEAGTNIVAALLAAMDDLSDPLHVPSAAQKSIILATDGISSCSPGFTPECAETYDRFVGAEARLLVGDDSILNELKRRKIALTVLMAGSDARPNLVDRKINGEYVSYFEAVALGLRGLIPGDSGYEGDPTMHPNLFIDSRGICEGSPCSDEKAHEKIMDGAADSYLQRPNGILGHMAIETGGIFCPLLPRGDLTPDGRVLGYDYVYNHWYEDHDGNPETPRRLKETSDGSYDNGRVLRADGQTLYMNPEFLSSGETAAECVRRTLGANPFFLGQQ